MRVELFDLSKDGIVPKVKFVPVTDLGAGPGNPVECEAASGESLLDIALSHGVDIQHACGGFCACTTCHCEVIEGAQNLLPPEEDELERLETLSDRTPSSRLSCQSKVQGDVTVRLMNS